MRSLSATHRTKRREKFKMKIEIKFNASTFRDAHNGTSRKSFKLNLISSFFVTYKNHLAKSLKLNLIFLLSATHKNQTSQKVANLSVRIEVTMVTFSRCVAGTCLECLNN